METTRIFTFILEYRGGTYISQAKASTIVAGVRAWVTLPTEDDLVAWELTRAGLLHFIEDHAPTPLNGLSGVWCMTGNIDSSLALLNIVDSRPV